MKAVFVGLECEERKYGDITEPPSTTLSVGKSVYRLSHIAPPTANTGSPVAYYYEQGPTYTTDELVAAARTVAIRVGLINWKRLEDRMLEIGKISKPNPREAPEQWCKRLYDLAHTEEIKTQSDNERLLREIDKLKSQIRNRPPAAPAPERPKGRMMRLKKRC